MKIDNPSCRRRTFLGTITAATVGLGGCNEGDGDGDVRILSLWSSNYDETAHTVEITLKESDEVVLRNRAELPPAEYRHGEVVDPIGREVSGVPDDPEAYVVEATVDDGEPHVLRTSELGAECVIVEARVERDGSGAIWHSTTCAPLSETQNTDDA